MLSPEELRSFPWNALSVLVVNEGEANTLLGALGEQGKRPVFGGPEVLGALVALPMLTGILGIVVTLGGRGAVASFSTPSGRETLELPAAKVKVRGERRSGRTRQRGLDAYSRLADTTGAGDTFLGYLCGKTPKLSPSYLPNHSVAGSRLPHERP